MQMADAIEAIIGKRPEELSDLIAKDADAMLLKLPPLDSSGCAA
jgi:hypothetical protein